MAGLVANSNRRSPIIMTLTAKQLVRPEIAGIKAYHVADASGLIKLDAMENPYALPAALRAELGQCLADVAINRYPDPHGGGLKDELRAAFDIPAAASVLLGNGSDEIITLIAQALARPGAVMLALEPSFVMYRMNALFSGLQYVGVPLHADFSLNLPALLEAIALHQPAVVFLSYPNNPTGPQFAREQVLAVLDAAPGLVVVDEAYQAFASDSLMDLAGSRANLLVMRTLSKLGLAGLRLGYAAGSAEWIDELDKVRPPYNINVLTQAAARFALRHLDVFMQQAQTLRDERQRLLLDLRQYPAMTVFDSQANFVTVRVPDAAELFAFFKKNGILIKNLHGSHPLLDQCLRLTVGSPDENTAVLAALAGYFA
jgi:histidinol-phosphate aminotransferase